MKKNRKSVEIDSDPVIDFVRHCAAGCLNVRRIWVFGSRARDRAEPQSDYDFALDWVDADKTPSLSDISWGAFAGTLREKNPSLNQLDLVRLSEASDSLKKRIQNEGVLIYEKDE